jgi:outer membrane protein TolC
MNFSYKLLNYPRSCGEIRLQQNNKGGVLMRKKITILFAAVFLCCLAVNATGVLDRYIESGLKNNLAMKQKEFSLQSSLLALKEAKGMFLPSITIEARYSRAGGGRVIDMPIGDMLNPLHSALNLLSLQHGFNPMYPTDIPNESIPFLRPSEQDTKVRLVQPLIQPGIYYNLKIKKDLNKIEKAKLAAFKRQLTADIKTAYFTYLKTVKVKELLDDTRGLLVENLRLSRSLFKNHKVTEEVVFRSKAELSKFEQQQAEAEKNCHLAASYFNFLLNRPLDEKIDIREYEKDPVFKDYNMEKSISRALERRDEFRQVEGAIAAAAHSAGLHKASMLPTVSAVFDYGYQGVEYKFTKDDDYWMGSLLLNWNLFNGGRDRAKKRQALYRKRGLQTRREELERQIMLQVSEAYRDLEVAKKTIVSSKDTLKSSQEAFFIITKKYRQDMMPQIEYTKARNDFTTAAISLIIAVYDYYIKEAQLEQASAK